MRNLSKKTLYTLIGIVGLLLLWEIIAVIVNSSVIIPSPIETIREFFSLLSSPALLPALLSTGLRAILGFCLALLFGTAFAILAYAYSHIRTMLTPFVTVLRATPTMSVILLAVIWFEPSVSPVFIGFLIIFPLLYESIYNALLSVDKKLIQMSKVYGVSTKNRLKSLYLPSIRKSVLSGARSAISLNVKVVIAGEVLAYTAKSIGMQMYITKIDIATASLFGWTIWALILSFIFESLVLLVDYLTDPVRIRNRKRAK